MSAQSRVIQFHYSKVPKYQEFIDREVKPRFPFMGLDANEWIEEDPRLVRYRDGCMRKPTEEELEEYQKFEDGEIKSTLAEEWIDDNWLLARGKLRHRELLDKGNRRKWGQEIGAIITGSFYYPTHGFREWHNNATDLPGWRLYYIMQKEDGKSWFNYLEPTDGSFVSVADHHDHINMFHIDPEKELLWHSIYSETDRISLGITLSNEQGEKLLEELKI